MENKNYDTWNNKKKNIELVTQEIYFDIREVWWCTLGINLGHEEDGKGADFTRQVLIFKKFNKSIFFGIPLSTKLKDNKYYIQALYSDNQIRAAMISQMKLISSKRLTNKECTIKKEEFEKIRKAVKDML